MTGFISTAPEWFDIVVDDDFSTFDNSVWSLSGDATYNSSGWIDLQSGSNSWGSCNWQETVDDGDFVIAEGEFEWVSQEEYLSIHVFSNNQNPTDGNGPSIFVRLFITFDSGQGRWESRLDVDDGTSTENWEGGAVSTTGTHTYRLEYNSNTGDILVTIDGSTEFDVNTSLRPSGQYINFSASSGSNSGSKDLHSAYIEVQQ